MLRACGIIILLLLGGGCFAADDPNPIVPPSAVPAPKATPWSLSVEPTFGFDSQQVLVMGFPPSGSPPTVLATATMRNNYQLLPVTLRYEPSPRRSMAITLPYAWREAKLDNGAGITETFHGHGLGDIMLEDEWTQRHGRTTSLEHTETLDLTLPTGKSPYSSLNADELPVGSGHFQATGLFGVRKITEPIIAGMQAGLNYSLPRTSHGVKFSPGLGFTVQTYLGFTMSDRWLVTEQLEYSRRSDVFLSSPTASSTRNVDEAYITHSFIYNPTKRNGILRLSFTTGLNDISTDYIIHGNYLWTF